MLPPALRRFVDMFNVVSGSQQMTQASVSLQQQWEMGMQTGSFAFHIERYLTPKHPSVLTLTGLSESTDTGMKAWVQIPLRMCKVFSLCILSSLLDRTEIKLPAS